MPYWGSTALWGGGRLVAHLGNRLSRPSIGSATPLCRVRRGGEGAKVAPHTLPGCCAGAASCGGPAQQRLAGLFNCNCILTTRRARPLPRLSSP